MCLVRLHQKEAMSSKGPPKPPFSTNGRKLYVVHSHFDLVSSFLALEATEPVSELVSQMALEQINNHLISVKQKR